MAITNAQQFKQLVNPPMKGNKRPGYRGSDMGREKGPETGRAGRDDREIGARADRTRAAAAANQRALAALGDPDPEVNVPTKDRKDTITSFTKNLSANFRSNPFSMITPLGTFLKTAYQTGKARSMLGLQNPTFDSNDTGGGDGIVPYWAQLGFNSEAEYLASLQAQAPSNMDQETEEEPEGLRLAFRAEGGPIGGEYDFESARQMYGLGKLVKKVGRTVKKIAKSPIGKAAIAAATIKFGGPLAAKVFPSTFGSAASSPFLRAIGRGQFFGDTGIFSAGKNILFGTNAGIRSTPGLFDKIPGGGITAAIAGTSLLAGLLTPKQEEEAQLLATEQGIDIEAARNSILARAQGNIQDDFRARGFRAEGGPAEGKEPVAKKTMPLLDMGGKEMDLREEGGFVPIGRMEKADDVPARLSKNEFVFTADAVRNAGDGDVDKGAEVMYNMMKNLEAGGDVSEESQGKEGARRMFQTSQRLEEVL